MDKDNILNINIASIETLVSPDELKKKLPISSSVQEHISISRQDIRNILDRKDSRLLVVLGPCSIHDPQAALEYAEKLKRLSEKLGDKLYFVFRVYFEKPRTTIGWKGFVNDPKLDDSFDIENGLFQARKLLIDLCQLGLALGTEALDPINPQYLHDLISWTAVGARTTESQTHREMASGLSTAVGFKNGTDGSINVAINAMKSSANPHSFLGINQKGGVSIVRTSGNKYSHVVLRGGVDGPNYDSVHVSLCEQKLSEAGLNKNIMIDCSHANSSKDFRLQPLVLNNVADQIYGGNTSIVGVMLESHLKEGNQKLSANLSYGVSITDACMSWEKTEECLNNFYQKIKSRN